jgi:hypothetical protein
VCGYVDEAPTEAHFSQMKNRIKKEGFRIIEAFSRNPGTCLFSFSLSDPP